MKNFTIIIDTQERTRIHRGYTFDIIVPKPNTIIHSMKTGDYSLSGYEDRITIERKSKADLYGSIGMGRDRFEREMARMSSFEFAAVVIEAEWGDIIKNPPTRSGLKPVSVLATVIAWMQRYNVHWITCPNRTFAEKTTYRLLDRWYRDEETGLHSKNG